MGKKCDTAMHQANQHQTINELYVEACGDLLSAYGLDVEIEERRIGSTGRDKDSYVSILGATGESILISSTLKIDRDLVVSTHPLGESDLSHEGLADWCRELNNQLVGRMKNKLLSYDQVLTVGVPVLIMGTDISPIAPGGSEVREYTVKAAQGQIILSLSTIIAAELFLQKVSLEFGAEAAMVEGTVVLF